MKIVNTSSASFLTGLAVQLSVAGVIGGIALLASTVLSGSGIYFSLAGTTLSDTARLVVSSISTLFLTLLAFQAWMVTGRKLRERKLRKPYAALPMPRALPTMISGMLLTSLSILTATTALLFLNNRDGIQALMNQSAFAETILPVNALETDLVLIAAAAARASTMADERSARESAQGGTCGVSPPGAGPRTRMRAEHAAEARNISGLASTLKEQAATITRALVTATDQAAVNGQFSAARDLALNPSRLTIADKADRLARGYGGEGFLFEGQPLRCDDPDLANLFRDIGVAALAVVELPMHPPVRRDVKIFDAFAVTIPVLLDSGIGQSAGITRASILPFVGFALLVDLVSLLGAFAHGTGRAVRMTAAEQDLLHRTSWLLRNFVWEFPPLRTREEVASYNTNKVQAYVYVPLGGNPDRTHQAELLTSKFGLLVDPEFQFEPLVASRDEDQPWVSQMKLASGRATHYALYPITSDEVYAQIQGMKHDAMNALGLRPLDTSELPEFGARNEEDVSYLHAV